jgi:short-subunit dehydrogenase
LEGYFKSLRYELNEFNIEVAMIEPAAFKTNVITNSIATINRITDYNSLRNKIQKFSDELVSKAEDPILVVNKVLKVVQTDKPKFRNIVGKGTSTLINLQHFAYGSLEKNVLKQLNK